jgi:hypothetical protein
MKATWPGITHSNRQWLLAYEGGWRELEAQGAGGVGGRRLQEFLWILTCARYAWDSWPIESVLDQAWDVLPGGERHPSVQEAQAVWLEWQLYLLSGRVERLQRCVDHFAGHVYEAPHLQSSGLLWPVIALSTLAEMADRLDQPKLTGHYGRRAMEAGQQAHSPAAEGPAAVAREMASLWLAPPGSSTTTALERLVDIVKETLSSENSQEHRAADPGVELSLLLMALLRRRQEVALLGAVAEAAIARCLPHRQRWRYLPPLLIDGVVGLEVDAGHNLLSWWLYASLPLGIEGLPFGSGQLSLQAEPKQGAGARISIHSSQPLTLEINTHERSYVEQLSPGEHTMLLTVLDRTDVRSET